MMSMIWVQIIFLTFVMLNYLHFIIHKISFTNEIFIFTFLYVIEINVVCRAIFEARENHFFFFYKKAKILFNNVLVGQIIKKIFCQLTDL